MRWFLWRIWYNFFWKTETVGNVRRVTNRFTGDFRLYKLHPLQMLGVDFSPAQQEIIKQLFRDEMIPEAQQLILKDIEDRWSVFELGNAFLKAVKELEDASPQSTD